LNNLPYTVVGVAEPGFAGTTFIGCDFWVPMAMEQHVRAADESLLRLENAVWMTAVGRLKPGVTPRRRGRSSPGSCPRTGRSAAAIARRDGACK
jgi:hypothetical protein